MRRRVPAWLAALVVLLVAASCSGGGDGGSANGACDGSATLNAKGVLRCLHTSVAYIETPAASGSGFVVDGGYVVTNAHVIDPYDRASIVFEGGARFDGVPVHAVDLLADLAILGPLQGLPATPPLVSGDALEQGDKVFLVGYPGETQRETPDVTISQGIVARLRTADPFGLRYVQTDAAIGGGQSGGALVDEHGRIVGVSGLSFAEKFALALRGDDVATALDALRAGKGSPYRPIADSGGVTDASVRIADPVHDLGFAIVRDAKPGTTLRVQLAAGSSGAFVFTEAATGAPWFATAGALDREELVIGSPITASDRAQYSHGRDAGNGAWDIDVPVDGELEITVLATAGAATDVRFTSSVPVQVFPDDDQGEAIHVGDTLDRTMQYTEWADTFVIDLQAGERIDVFVGSPTADMAFSIIGPGETAADAAFVDGTGLGMLGLDERTTFTAKASGRHVISVVGDGVSSGYRIRVAKG